MKKILTVLTLLTLLTFQISGQQEMILTHTGMPYDHFGAFVATHNYYLMAGAPGRNASFPGVMEDIGAVFVYEMDAPNWVQTNVYSGLYEFDSFGSSIAIVGDAAISFAIVGSPIVDDDNIHLGWEGHASILINSLQNNGWEEHQIIFPGEEADPNSFGQSVNILCDGGYYALISSGHKIPNSYGDVSIYQNSFYYPQNGTWDLQTVLQGFEDWNPSVAIDYYEDGTFIFIAVGEEGDEYQGKVHVYNGFGNMWEEHTVATASDGHIGNQFGNKVLLEIPYLIVSAPHDNENGIESGAVYIYEYDHPYAWNEWPKIFPDDISPGDLFGSSIAFCGGGYLNEDDFLIVGAPGVENEKGAVYVFRLDQANTLWEQIGKLMASDGEPGDLYGISVSSDDHSTVIGAPNASYFGGEVEIGKTYVYHGVTEGLLLSSTSYLNFGAELVGEIKTLPVTIQNQSLIPVNIESISYSGYDTILFNTDFIPVNLAPGEGTEINISFSPQDVGTFTAHVLFDSDANYIPIDLFGIGAYPIDVTPESIAFGEVNIGYTPTDTVIISNVSSSPQTIDSIKVEGPNSNQFQPNITSSSFDIPADSEVEIIVNFYPNVTGPYEAYLVVYNQTIYDTVFLSATGIQAGQLYLLPTTLDFGPVSPTMSVSDTVFVGNIGSYPLEINSNVVTGTGADVFNAPGLIPPVELNPGQYIPLLVYFGPNSITDYTATLNIGSNGGNMQVSLTGSGTDAGVMLQAPSEINFYDVTLGYESTQEVLIGNFGISQLSVGPITITGDNPEVFSIETGNFILEPTYIKRLELSFVPNTSGNFYANLNINSNGGNKIVPLSGSCISCSPYGEIKLTNMNMQGMAVSLSEGHAVVYPSYFYRCNGEDWIETSQYDHYSMDYAMDGMYTVVGLPYDDNIGSIRIYKRANSSWQFASKLIAEDYFYNDNFGWSVDFDGKHLIVGAPLDDDNDLMESGSAYIFRRSTDVWYQIDKIHASDPVSGTAFGSYVSISGDYAIVGQPNDDTYGLLAGTVYVYKQYGSHWIQNQKLFPDDPGMVKTFGASVSMSGNYMIIGSPSGGSTSDGGSAYIFHFNDSIWVQQAKLIPSYIGEQFGYAVSISGDYAIVGAPMTDGSLLTDMGEAFLFHREETAWVEIRRIHASDPYDLQQFGTDVDVDGNFFTAIVGTMGPDVYIYGDSLFLGIDEDKSKLPNQFSLEQNYPNPFSTETSIRYIIPKTCNLDIGIYNLLGEKVRDVFNGKQTPGMHEIIWDGKNNSGFSVKSGVYYCRLRINSLPEQQMIKIQKMVLIR